MMKKINEILSTLLVAIMPWAETIFVFLALGEVHSLNDELAELFIFIAAGIGIAIITLWFVQMWVIAPVMSHRKKKEKFDFPFEYKIKEKEQYTLDNYPKTKILIVPETAALWTVNYFAQREIPAYLEKDMVVFEKYEVKPKYIIRTVKEVNSNESENDKI